MKRLLFATVLIVGFVTSAFSQARPTLGVLPFTGGAGQEGDVIASLFLNQRELRDVFNVVPRTMALSAIFTERQFQLSDLTDPDTIASLNRMLNADYVLSGNITRLGDRNLLIASIVNVETFQQVAGYHVTYRNIEEIIGLLPSMASGMANTARRQGVARPPSLAVIPFTHRAGVSAQDAETLAQILAIEILNTGRYAVLSRLSIIQAALREQGFQMLGYTDDAGMASLGRAMNADMVLGGSITGLGAVNLFMAQILNVEDGRVIEGDSVRYQAITDGIELMGELAILLAYPPGQQRDGRLTELRLGLGHSVPVPGTTLADQLAWLRANASSDTHYVIGINDNVNINHQFLSLPSGRSNVTVTLHGRGAMRTINFNRNVALPLFMVGSGITLILDDNITLQGRSDNDRFLVEVGTGGTLVMNSGARIAGNVGGGVLVGNGGTFAMYGGTISGNTGTRGFRNASRGISGSHGSNASRNIRATAGGAGGNNNSTGNNGDVGGVSVNAGGTFVMSGGTITGNSGGIGGQGGYGGQGGRGGSDMHSRGHGGTGGSGGMGSSGGMGGAGGVKVNSGGTFAMQGGTITGNSGGIGGIGGEGGLGGSGGQSRGTSGTRGNGGRGGAGGIGGVGGVHNLGTFTIHGGTIAGNRSGAAGQGGSGGAGMVIGAMGASGSEGIYGDVRNEGAFTMHGGAISSNSGGNHTVRVANGVLQ